MKFYGNVYRDCLMETGSNNPCSHFFEENEDDNDV